MKETTSQRTALAVMSSAKTIYKLIRHIERLSTIEEIRGEYNSELLAMADSAQSMTKCITPILGTVMMYATSDAADEEYEEEINNAEEA